MTTQSRLDAMALRTNRLSVNLTVVGGVCLLAIVIVVTLCIVMRYAFDAPLLGFNEFVQLAAVALVMASLPYCTAKNDLVAVDVFENMLGRWGRFIGNILSKALSGGVLAVLTYRAALKALEWGDATNMLRLPIWPRYAILAAGTAGCVVILRPDQHVAHVLPLHAQAQIAASFAGFMFEPAGVSPVR